jgi:hypothetical protein
LLQAKSSWVVPIGSVWCINRFLRDIGWIGSIDWNNRECTSVLSESFYCGFFGGSHYCMYFWTEFGYTFCNHWIPTYKCIRHHFHIFCCASQEDSMPNHKSSIIHHFTATMSAAISSSSATQPNVPKLAHDEVDTPNYIILQFHSHRSIFRP